MVERVWFNPEDGWFWCAGHIDDKTAENLIENKGWSVSCSYDVLLADDAGGTENNIKYDMEFLDGNFTHLALVNNPRYERANIVFNSKTEYVNKVDNERWITVHPHGKDSEDYRKLKLEDGETPKEAIERTYGNGHKESKENNRYYKKTDYELMPSGYVRKIEYNDGYDTWGNGDAKHTFLTKEEYEKETGKKYNDLQKDKPDTKDGEEDFEKETKSSPKDENRHQKVRDLEDKAYKEFKTMYDNYIDKDGMEGWGGIPASQMDKAVAKFNKKYKDEFDKLESDRFVSFEDFAKRENKQSDTQAEKEETTPEEPQKTDLEQKREAYENTLKKLNDAEHRKWHPKDNADWYAAVKEGTEAKKALTDLRRDYAESIMSNFEEVEDNPYEDKLEAKRERYQELSEKASKQSDAYSKASHDMISAIPMGQPILVGHHSEMRDRRYRQRAWDKMDKAYQLSKKADYYEDKAKSVGKSGISADDKNAIKKLSDKYNSIKRTHQRMLDANKIIKSKATDEEKRNKLMEAGWSEKNAIELTTPSKWSGSVGFQSYELTSNTAEMRRIIDRVIDIHKRSLKAVEAPATDTNYSDLGFEVERNTDINRLQLKFPGKPDDKTRSILKSNGFRWSPREGAWQRQLTGNAEYSLKRISEQLKADNALYSGIEEIIQEHTPDKKDVDILNKLKGIFE